MASIRRTPAAIPPSLMILKRPMSPVRETCAAAQFGRETAHLQYAYFVAVFFAEEHHGVGFCASSMLIMAALTATLAKTASLTRRSTSAISSAVTAWGWEMSKRVDSAVTKEPFVRRVRPIRRAGLCASGGSRCGCAYWHCGFRHPLWR